MPNGRKVRRKLTKRIVQRYGLDTFILRYDPSSGALDAYGEPIVSPWPFAQIPVRIVIDTDKRDSDYSSIGGLTDDKREYIYFYVKGDFDIRLGDRIVYPANSEAQWVVGMLTPNMFNDVSVINEVKAFRDDRT